MAIDDISLRYMTINDISQTYLNWLNDKTYLRYSNQRFLSHNYTSAVEYVSSFDQQSSILMKIEFNKTFAGTLALNCDPHNGVGVMGILIGKEFSSKGIGKEAWSQGIKFGFSHKNLRKVKAGTAKSNLAMQSIFLESGMKQEAILREDLLIDGKYEDLLLFCIFNLDQKEKSIT